MNVETAASIVLERCAQKGDGLVIGLSGGADSTALLAAVRAVGGYGLRAVHVNHGLRESAGNDAAFCAELCADMGVPLDIVTRDVKAAARQKGLTVEQAGRECRYGAFEEARLKAGATFILTAHHKGDVAETLLLNLFRGAGLCGLGSIKERRGNVIRPFIGVSRADIEGYLKSRGIAHINDETNGDERFSRNYVRNALLPGVKARLNPAAEEALCRTALITADEDAFLDGLAEAALEKAGGLTISGLNGMSAAIRRRAARLAIAGAKGGSRDISAKHVDALLSLTGKQSGKSVDLGCGLTARRRFASIELCGREAPLAFSYDIAPGETLYIPEIGMTARLSGSPGGGARLSAPVPNGPLTIRTRLAGDVFRGRKLKRFLIEERIPINERARLFYAASGGTVYWVAGRRAAEFDGAKAWLSFT